PRAYGGAGERQPPAAPLPLNSRAAARTAAFLARLLPCTVGQMSFNRKFQRLSSLIRSQRCTYVAEQRCSRIIVNFSNKVGQRRAGYVVTDEILSGRKT